MKVKNYLIGLVAMLFIGSHASAQVKAEFSITDSVICTGDYGKLTANSTSVMFYYWKFGDNQLADFTKSTVPTTNHQYFKAGTFIVTLIVEDSKGNKDTTQKTLRVMPEVKSSFSFNQNSNNGFYCLSTEFSISQWSNLTGFDSLYWDFGDGNNSTLRYPKHQFNKAGVYPVKLKAFGFCGMDSFTNNVTIVDDERGTPNINLYVYNNTTCLGEEVGFQASTYEQVLSNFMIYTGDGNSTSLDEFQYTYPKLGTYKAMAVATNVCGNDTAYATINVVDQVDNRPYINTDQNICASRPSRVSVGAYNGGLDTAFISFGDGDTAIRNSMNGSVMHTYAMSGTYEIKVIYKYLNCSSPDTLTKSISVATDPTIYKFYLRTSKNQVCPNEEVSIYGPSLSAIDTFNIDYGDGTSEQFTGPQYSIKHKYMNPGNYQLKGIRKTVCGSKVTLDSSTIAVQVMSNLKSELGISAEYSSNEELRCFTDSVTFNMAAFNSPILNPMYTFEDGTTYAGKMVKKAMDKAGTYTVLATAENLCGEKLEAAYTYVTTKKMLNPSISGYSYPRAQCVNQEFLFDMFTNNATSVSWDFGDGNMAQGMNGPHMMYAYTKAGTYDVLITAKNACGETTDKRRVYVVAGPEVDFTMSDNSIKVNDTLKLENTTKDALSFLWVFNADQNDTSTAMKIERKYTTMGRFPISLFAINEFGCWDTLSKFIAVGQINTEQLKSKSYSVYPNPSNGILQIDLGKINNAEVHVYDMNGRIQHKESIKNNCYGLLDLKHFKTGTYILKIHSKKELFTTKIVIQP